MALQADQKGAVSTKAVAYAATGVDNYDINFPLIPAFPELADTDEERNQCGGAHPTGVDTIKRDITLNMEGRAYPRQVAFLNSYWLGGGDEYAITGAGDPYLHTAKENRPSTVKYDSFPAMHWFDSTARWYEYRGAQVDTLEFGGDLDTDNGAIGFKGTAFTNGQEYEVTSGFTPPTCVEEDVYRIGDSTVSLAPYGGSAITGLDISGWSAAVNNNLDTNPRRSGLYVAAARDHGVQVYTATLTIIGEPGDTVDNLKRNRTYIALTIANANATANRVWTIYGLRGTITKLTRGFSRSINIATHTLEIRFWKDATSAPTIANSPLYSTIQSGVATFRA